MNASRVGVVLVLCAGLVGGGLLYATAPSAERDSAQVEGVNARAPGSDGQAPGVEQGPVEPRTEAASADDDAGTEATRRRSNKVTRGALRRIEQRLRELERVDPGVRDFDGMNASEIDAAIARPIHEKAVILEAMAAEVDGLRGLDNPSRAARGLVMLARGQTHMAEFLEDRPVPPYLDSTAADQWLDALDDRIAEREDHASTALGEARELAFTLPDDDPANVAIDELPE